MSVLPDLTLRVVGRQVLDPDAVSAVKIWWSRPTTAAAQDDGGMTFTTTQEPPVLDSHLLLTCTLAGRTVILASVWITSIHRQSSPLLPTRRWLVTCENSPVRAKRLRIGATPWPLETLSDRVAHFNTASPLHLVATDLETTGPIIAADDVDSRAPADIAVPLGATVMASLCEDWDRWPLRFIDMPTPARLVPGLAIDQVGEDHLALIPWPLWGNLVWVQGMLTITRWQHQITTIQIPTGAVETDESILSSASRVTEARITFVAGGNQTDTTITTVPSPTFAGTSWSTDTLIDATDVEPPELVNLRTFARNVQTNSVNTGYRATIDHLIPDRLGDVLPDLLDLTTRRSLGIELVGNQFEDVEARHVLLGATVTIVGNELTGYEPDLEPASLSGVRALLFADLPAPILATQCAFTTGQARAVYPEQINTIEED